MTHRSRTRPAGTHRRNRTPGAVDHRHNPNQPRSSQRAHSLSVAGHTVSPTVTHTSRGGSNTRRSSSTLTRFP